jgi:hypothetical protein
MEMCLVPRLSCRPSSNVPRLPSFLKVLQNPHVWFTAVKVQNPLCLPWKVAFERAKVPQTWGVFGILTSKCACHSRMHFLALASLLTFSTLRNRKTLEKHSVSWLFYLFARFDLLSIYIIYSLFSDSSQDCCCICPWVVSLTSKLPSVRFFWYLLDSIGHIDRMLSTWYYNSLPWDQQ